MEFKKLDIEDVILVKPDVFGDNRGYFYESYNQKNITNGLGKSIKFVQDNLSYSNKKNTIRGVHFQKKYPQSKLVSCVRGAILDVSVDVRKESKTFGKWVSAELSDTNNHQLWVPAGFAHGFITLTDNTVVSYKLDNFYQHDLRVGFMWNDELVNIDWGINDDTEVILSEQDKNYPTFNNLGY